MFLCGLDMASTGFRWLTLTCRTLWPTIRDTEKTTNTNTNSNIRNVGSTRSGFFRSAEPFTNRYAVAA